MIGIDQHAEEVGQIVRMGLQVCNRMPSHDLLRVEAGIVVVENVLTSRVAIPEKGIVF